MAANLKLAAYVVKEEDGTSRVTLEEGGSSPDWVRKVPPWL